MDVNMHGIKEMRATSLDDVGATALEMFDRGGSRITIFFSGDMRGAASAIKDAFDARVEAVEGAQ